MRDYGKVHTSFWASETLQGCGNDARLLALYLLTCSHSNMAGAFRLPDAYASEDLGWTSERFRNGLAALEAAGFLSYCPRTKWVWIVKFLEWNRPENPNQWKAVAKFMAAIPENCSFKGKGFERVPEQFRNSPVPVPVPVPVPTPDPEKPRANDPLAGVDAQVAKDFTAMRKALKAPITETAVSGIKREADKLGLSLDSALRICVERNWRGFKAEWMHKDGPAPARQRRDL